MEEYLSLSEGRTIKENDVITTEEYKNEKEKKVSLEKGLDVTITRYKENKNKIKVGINCIDGDLIGGGNNFLDIQPDKRFGGDKFQQTFEKGLKGYLNLIFGCNYMKAIEEADFNSWWNTEALGKGREDVAMVGIVSRAKIANNTKIEESTRIDSSLVGTHSSAEKTNFEKIWSFFEGQRPRDVDKRTPIVNTAVEAGIYNRKDLAESYKTMIQKLVRESIANSLMRLVLQSTGYTERYFNTEQKRGWKYRKEQKYNASEEFNKIVSQNDQDETFKKIKLDGNEGFKGNPGNGTNGGKPKGMWDNIKEWNSGDQQGGNEIKKYLKEISTSSYFDSKNSEIAKFLCFEIFKNLIGKKKFQIVKSKNKGCKVGGNGVTCPNGGLAGRKE